VVDEGQNGKYIVNSNYNSHCKKDPIDVCLEMKMCGLIPSLTFMYLLPI
jgi:hypothetical protein